jgi:hypothetical protein
LHTRLNSVSVNGNGMFMPDTASNSQAVSHRFTCLRLHRQLAAANDAVSQFPGI